MDRHNWMRPTIGALSCSMSAVVLSEFLQKASFKTALPIWFLVIILLVAMRFGTLAGTLGTILAVAIFAYLLFEPLHSLDVQSQTGRNSLLWMFLGGLVLSEFFGHPPPHHPPHEPKNPAGPSAV